MSSLLEDVELARIQQQLAVAGFQRLPEVARIVAVLVVEVDDARMATPPKADNAGGQVDADAADRELGRLAALQAQLVQPRARAHQHREGLRRDLDIERPLIAGVDVVEGAAMVGQQANEDVHAAGRALRVAPRRNIARQGQPLLDLGDVDAALFQHRTLGQVQLVHGHVPETLGDATMQAWQKRGADPPGARAQAQVQAGGLHLIDVERRG